MKIVILFLVLTFSGASFADSNVWPRLMNWGHRVELELHNTSQNYVSCSGWIDITLLNRGTQSTYVFERIWPRQMLRRSFYPRNMERIIFARHSIFCY